MISKKTAILLLIFMGLFAYVYFFEVLGDKRKQATREQDDKIVQVDRDHVSRLKLVPAKITIEKQGAGWKIIDPVVTDADQSVIQAIFDELDRLKKGRFVSDNTLDFKKFGLAPFHAALIIQGQDGKQDSLLLGDKNLDSTEVFFRKSNSHDVYLIPISLLNQVSRSLFDLRDKSVITFGRDDIARIVIQNRNETFSCVRDSALVWRLEYPIHDRCDQERINDLLMKLEFARISDVISEQPDKLSKYGLVNPWLSISLFEASEAAKQQTLFIGKARQDKFYSRNDSKSHIFLIDSSLVSGLNVSLFDLRDKSIVDFEQDSIFEVELKYENTKFHCLKDSTKKWFIIEPDSGLAKSWKISGLLYNIKDIQVDRFVDVPGRHDDYYGLKTPAIELILRNDRAIIAHLQIGKQINTNVFLKNKLTHKIYQVKKTVKETLQVDIKDYIDSEN